MTSTTINAVALRRISIRNTPNEIIETRSKVQTGDNSIVGYLKPLQVRHEETVIALTQWLTQSKIVGKLGYNLNAARALNNHQHEVTLNFSLADKYANQFILLRGLFEFNNIKDVTVTADRTTRTFKVVFNINQPTSIIEYFETIFNSLVKEINFKNILRGIIRLEERIKREQALAYETLRAAV
jgi:hypothetical protein